MSRTSTKFAMFLLSILSVLLLISAVFAQETTGGLQGTVKDPSGAVVPKASVTVTGTTLVGAKSLETDSSGYYRFANLPPGVYTVTVKAAGFSELKREGITIEVGHLPTLDLVLAVGAAGTVVEVTGAAPLVDVTTNTNQTNVTSDVIENVPHGYSFQSVIQYAPMARNEPLAGNSLAMGGTGGAIPGSSSNGFANGYMIGGSADSESTYLVEGQDTEDISGGASRAQVPFDFIQEVQVKTSGIEAEHGGALGGVVNVVMKKGGNSLHGSLYGSYEAAGMDGSENPTLRYDPNDATPNPVTGENSPQIYVPQRDAFHYIQPGGTLGGPILKDRLWFFLGFEPFLQSIGRSVNFAPAAFPGNSSLGEQNFTQSIDTYYGTARLDATLTQKIRVFGSWLYQYQRETGANLPGRDPIASQAAANYLNTYINSPIQSYSSGIGYSEPNSTYNVGADITLTPKLVSTTRFGYFFTNYHDFGWPTTGVDLFVVGAPGLFDNSGNPGNCNGLECEPGPLQLPSANTNAYDMSYTDVNASKHYQLNEDIAYFKGGSAGTHNFKFGYQYNRLWNIISQHGNIPQFVAIAIPGYSYSFSTAYGASQCGSAPTTTPPSPGSGLEANLWFNSAAEAFVGGTCAGQYGVGFSNDFATILKNTSGGYAPAIDNNHAFFAQDAWTIGHGLTLNLGVRIEKESLPAPAGVGTANIRTIDFSWSDKIEPRLGAAWGSRDGKIKLFGSYGVVNDVMKLLLAQSSYGAQLWNRCEYPIGPDANNTFSYSDATFQFFGPGLNQERACPTAADNVGANFANGVIPQAFTNVNPLDQTTQLIENVNFRPEEPVMPNLKPYRQHEFVAGGDYQITKDWALEARYDRRRLDHIIEDASLSAPCCFEYYNIVNPGEGVNKTLDGYAAYLRGLGSDFGLGVPPFDPGNGFDPTGICAAAGSCPNNPTAIRDYDGVEVRITKAASKGWAGMFSYTWSRLWGNYTGLTTTDQLDGGITGRDSPNTTRSFDEPFYYFSYLGKSNAGPLPTDRPNAFKGNVYYTLPSKLGKTTIGIFQTAYQGSPMSSWANIAIGGETIEGTYIWGHGNWVNATTDATGAVTFGNPYARRTPWLIQSDLNAQHAFKVNKNNDRQELTISATFINLLNQHAVVSYWAGLDSDWLSGPIFTDQIATGASFYKLVESGYSPQAVINAQSVACAPNLGINTPCPFIQNSQYNLPNVWQPTRNIRIAAKFTF